MRCSTDPADNLARAIDRIRAAARDGAQLICLPELFRSQYFCQTEDHANFDLAEPIPGPEHGGAGRRGARDGHGAHRLAVRATGGRRLSQHGGDHRRRRAALRQLPQDAHPRRSFLLREVLFHAGRSRFPRLRHRRRPDRHARLLGSVVPGRRPADRAGGRRRAVLPDRDRLAPRREGRVRRGAGLRLADRAARARHRQRRLRRGRQPGRAGEAAQRNRRARGSNFGAAASSPIRSASCWPRRRAPTRRR